jgi:hypothetical protein
MEIPHAARDFACWLSPQRAKTGRAGDPLGFASLTPATRANL